MAGAGNLADIRVDGGFQIEVNGAARELFARRSPRVPHAVIDVRQFILA